MLCLLFFFFSVSQVFSTISFNILLYINICCGQKLHWVCFVCLFLCVCVFFYGTTNTILKKNQLTSIILPSLCLYVNHFAFFSLILQIPHLGKPNSMLQTKEIHSFILYKKLFLSLHFSQQTNNSFKTQNCHSLLVKEEWITCLPPRRTTSRFTTTLLKLSMKCRDIDVRKCSMYSNDVERHGIVT